MAERKPNYDEREWFHEHIEPLVNRVVELCAERGIPGAVLFQTHFDDEGMTLESTAGGLEGRPVDSSVGALIAAIGYLRNTGHLPEVIAVHPPKLEQEGW